MKARHHKFRLSQLRSHQAVDIIPSLRAVWTSFDSRDADYKLRSINIGIYWLFWGWCLTWNILTERPWTASAYWKDKPDELLEAQERLDKAAAKKVRQVAARAMQRVKL